MRKSTHHFLILSLYLFALCTTLFLTHLLLEHPHRFGITDILGITLRDDTLHDKRISCQKNKSVHIQASEYN